MTRNEDLKIVKKENRKRRKAIESYQEMMSSGATGVHPVSGDCVRWWGGAVCDVVRWGCA